MLELIGKIRDGLNCKSKKTYRKSNFSRGKTNLSDYIILNDGVQSTPQILKMHQLFSKKNTYNLRWYKIFFYCSW